MSNVGAVDGTVKYEHRDVPGATNYNEVGVDRKYIKLSLYILHLCKTSCLRIPPPSPLRPYKQCWMST